MRKKQVIFTAVALMITIPIFYLGYGYWYVNKPKPFCDEIKSNFSKPVKCPNITSSWHSFYDVDPCPICIERSNAETE